MLDSQTVHHSFEVISSYIITLINQHKFIFIINSICTKHNKAAYMLSVNFLYDDTDDTDDDILWRNKQL